MSTCDDPDPDQTRTRIYHALEAILRSPVTGQAVAEVLACRTTEREVRTMVADLRARRAQRAYDRDADLFEEARFQHDAPSAPWARLA
jgi:hypothetical protein